MARRGLAGALAQRGLDLRDRIFVAGDVPQVLHAGLAGMGVGVIEPRQHELPMRVNDARARTGERFYLGARADGGNAVAGDRDGFRGRTLRLHGVDRGVDDD